MNEEVLFAFIDASSLPDSVLPGRGGNSVTSLTLVSGNFFSYIARNAAQTVGAADLWITILPSRFSSGVGAGPVPYAGTLQ